MRCTATILIPEDMTDVEVRGVVVGVGEGHTKKTAQLMACHHLLLAAMPHATTYTQVKEGGVGGGHWWHQEGKRHHDALWWLPAGRWRRDWMN